MQIYNTETRRKQVFEPSELPVKMYVCGLTPKNEPHIGHARVFVVNDVIRRYLEYRGYPVHYVQNFTDIDDKIIAAGLRENIPPSVAARRYRESYFRDMDRLNVRRADEFTLVTEYIPQIIEMVAGLIERGHAYELEGDVYFSVPSFPTYGRLSGRDERAMQVGASIEPDERKHDPRDFALWKAAKPGEPWWQSPWGKGRPGWHIECSTMAMKTLGAQIDIHGGGSDLIFPHHENEIAQSESYSSVSPFARYWMHTGMLNLGSDKLSHSDEATKMAHSGEFVTVRSVLADGTIPAPALRTYLLGQHYRALLTYSEEQLRATVVRWQRWAQTDATLKRLIAWAGAQVGDASDDENRGEVERALAVETTRIRADFLAALDDDFNTSAALSALDELAHRANDYASGLGETPTPATLASLRGARAALDELSGVALGIQLEEGAATTTALSDEQRQEVEALLTQRTEARARRDWPEADRIRNELDERFNVAVKDTPQGPTWSVRE
jgi:cysteinyl-tRNA synthetase